MAPPGDAAAGYYAQLPRYAARCTCGRHKITPTLRELNTWAASHDDSPWQRHTVTWAGPGLGWPTEEEGDRDA